MGNVDFGVIGCRETVPDIWAIADGFGQAVLELKKRADEESGAPAAKAARPRAAAKQPVSKRTTVPRQRR